MKKNLPKKYEPISVVVIPDEYPLVYNAMIKSLMNRGMTKAEAVAYMIQPIELELYYDENSGLFAVEPAAVESTNIFNPYTGEELEDYDKQ
mgnify:CR=1 FL=1|jgi:hypothetical protein